MYQKPTQPRTIGGTLQDTFRLFQAALPRCVLPALLFGAVSAGLSGFHPDKLPLVTGSEAGLQELLTRLPVTSPHGSLLSLLDLVCEVALYTLLTVLITAVSEGAAPRLGPSLARALRRLPAMIGACILFLIPLVIGVVILLIPVAAALAGLITGGDGAAALAVAVPVGLVCIVVDLPIAYLLSRMQLFLVPLVAENQGPLESIATSWRLVGGNLWRTSAVASVIVIIILVMLLVELAIGMAVVFPSLGVTATAVSLPFAATIVAAVAQVLFQMICAPLLVAMCVALYQDLQLRHRRS